MNRIRYDRAVYDALFVAFAEEFQVRAVTADEPLGNGVQTDFPRVHVLKSLCDPTEYAPADRHSPEKFAKVRQFDFPSQKVVLQSTCDK